MNPMPTPKQRPYRTSSKQASSPGGGSVCTSCVLRSRHSGAMKSHRLRRESRNSSCVIYPSSSSPPYPDESESQPRGRIRGEPGVGSRMGFPMTRVSETEKILARLYRTVRQAAWQGRQAISRRARRRPSLASSKSRASQ